MLLGFNITQRGLTHIEKDTPCQDYSKIEHVISEDNTTEYVVSAVSDGVGSCPYSQYGAEVSVETAIKSIQKTLEDGQEKSDERMLEILNASFEDAYDAVLSCADEKEIPFAQLDCTLTVSVFDGENVWFGHIGDDGIVALFQDGTYKMITRRHKGEFANSVIPLRFTDIWQFGKAEKPVAGLVMMTDGVLDYIVGTEFTNNRVFFPFIQPCLDVPIHNEEDLEKLKEEYETYLGNPDFRKAHINDDITFLAVQNSESVEKLPEISFDLEQWNQDTKRYEEMIDDYLYKEFYKNKKYESAQPNKEDHIEPEQQKTALTVELELYDDDDNDDSSHETKNQSEELTNKEGNT